MNLAHASADYETYSEAGYVWIPEKEAWRSIVKNKTGIAAVGVAVYAEHPSTEVRCLSYRLPGSPTIYTWRPGDPPPVALFRHIQAGGLVEAHNSAFEWLIWQHVCHRRMGWPYLPLCQMRCSMARAKAFSLPGKLDKALEALHLPVGKDKRGQALIRKLSIPQSWTKKSKITKLMDPDLLDEFAEYNRQDVVAEDFLSAHCPELSPFELEVWKLDQEINLRGVSIDRVGLEACQNVVAQANSRYTNRLRQVTGGAVETVDETEKMCDWLTANGLPTKSVAKDTVSSFLKKDIPPVCREVLEIRQYLGSASVRKLETIARMLCSDGRLRELFAYAGAGRTQRWAGRGPQPQNLPSSGPQVLKCPHCKSVYWAGLSVCRHCGHAGGAKSDWAIEAVELALNDICRLKDLSALEALWGDVLTLIAGCLRGLFVASEGCELIASDYSAIEAVVLAMLAGEQWRIDVFRTHGKIYEMCASRITGVPLEELLNYKKTQKQHHPFRKPFGKIPELASGYGGGLGAWLAFGAGEFMTDDEIRENVKKWRADSPAITAFWDGLQDAAVTALQCPGRECSYRGIAYVAQSGRLFCRLPSGRWLTYHDAYIGSKTLPWGEEAVCIYYMGWNSDSTKGPVGWHLQDTYGPKLTENVVQATARDIMAFGLLNLNEAGYRPVLHVHDEIASEVLAGTGSIAEFEQIMSTMPPWAADWPIKAAGGWRGRRYRKD